MQASGSKNKDTGKSSEYQFKILRFDPGQDAAPCYKIYYLACDRGMTVLDALMRIRETQDPTLSYRKSCRMGICGSCAMFVNGKPVLACQTQLSELASVQVEVKPLPNFPILRDLVPDLRSLFRYHESVKPYIIREDTRETDHAGGEFMQTSRELENYLQFAYCIKCGACLAACPTCATDENFTGPQALAAAYRYAADSRDSGTNERLEYIDGPNGIWRCHFAGSCSEACPKGVDPSLGIQLLKKEICKSRLSAGQKVPAPLALVQAGAARRKDIPSAPPPNVEK